MRRALAVLLGASIGAAALAPGAAAHARLIRSEPAAGAVLVRAPLAVLLFFDDTVRPASGIEAIRNGGASVLSGRPHTAPASQRELVLPLRPHLPVGDYTVRWRIVSDDGHLISGVLAFAVGSGRAPPVPALHAGGSGPPAGDVLRRFVFFAGVLVAVGALAFQLLVWRGETRSGPLVLAAGFALTLAGAHPVLSPSTRFERLDDVAAVAAACGLLAGAASYGRPRLRLLAVPPALALLAVPTFRGHALDPGASKALAVTADLIHVGAAAFWIGCLVQLALVLPRLPDRRSVVRHFSTGAVVAVALIGATGILRAVGELSAVDQLWRTGYGRALIVKTGLLGGLFALGFLNRRRLRLPTVGAELLLLAGVVTAVAVLTDLRPGRQLAVAAPPPRAPASSPLRLPPRGALVLAKENGDLAVALAVRPAGRRVELTASVVGQDRLGVDGLDVSFRTGGLVARARPCGGGCYTATVSRRPRLVAVRFDRSAVSFELPASWPPRPAAALISRATRVYESLRSLVIRERLASSPTNGISTVYELVAPDRLAYRIRGGAAGIVIGSSRWDKDTPTAPWVRSGQSPIREPVPFWISVSNAYVLRATPSTLVVSFLDRRIPAWFEVSIDRRSYRTLALRMTAAAHFMRHRYGPFNAPLSIRPPRRPR